MTEKKRADRGRKVASPPETPEIAVSLAKAGWPVFPVTIYEDASGKRHKVPAVKWKEWATTDEMTVATAWAGEHSGRWIGVYAGKAGIAVLDVDPGGDDSIRDAGLEIPSTFNYPTHRKGGRHHVFAAPEGIELTIARDLVVDGVKLDNVDVRSGAGLMVYYGPALDGTPDLAPAPDWLLVTRGREAYNGGIDRDTSATEDRFRDRLVDSPPKKKLAKLIRGVEFPKGAAHEPMLEVVAALIGEGVKGTPGVLRLMDETRERYISGGPDRARDWDNAVAGSVRRLGLPPATIPLSKAERKAIKVRNAPEAIEARKAERKGVYRAEKHKAAIERAAGDRVLEDSPLADELAPILAGTWAYSQAHGLMRYAKGVWQSAPNALLVEAVRRHLTAIELEEHTAAAMRGDNKAIDKARTLLSKNRAKAVAELALGILMKHEPVFDDHPDLLNVKNGVVDLRTGDLSPHDPALYLTKMAGAAYKPDADRKLWKKALKAVPVDVADWMQIRFGQAATGYTPDDDKLIVLEGVGANGKTTWVGGVRHALGDYARVLPEKLFMGDPRDHSTEMMTLIGVRLGFVEETPEGRRLNVKRLKDVVGTEEITARALYRDNVTFKLTASVMMTTNYALQVNETDYGTWRRLARVVFPYKYVAEPSADNELRGDPDLRRKLQTSAPGREAVLAWIVEGACRWYDADRVMPLPPARVVADTEEWRASADLVYAFAVERLTFSPAAKASTREIADAFSSWLFNNGHAGWSHQTITSRLAGHEVMTRKGGATLARTRIDGKLARAWVGVEVRPNEALLNSLVSPRK